MTPNSGHCPEHLRWRDKRVHVQLRNGRVPSQSWPVDGRGGLRWSLKGCPFDVVAFEEVR